SNASLLEYWWLTDRSSSCTVPIDADHSLLITTASCPPTTAASTAIAERTPVTGTCPFRKPSSRERRNCGSSSRSARTTGSPVTAAGCSIASSRSPGRFTTNNDGDRDGDAAADRSSSTVTRESTPPPNGINAVPAGAENPAGADDSAVP